MVEPIKVRAGDASSPVPPVTRLGSFSKPNSAGGRASPVEPKPKIVAWYASMTELWDYLRREAAAEEARRFTKGE